MAVDLGTPRGELWALSGDCPPPPEANPGYATLVTLACNQAPPEVGEGETWPNLRSVISERT